MPFWCWWEKSWEESKFAVKLRSCVCLLYLFVIPWMLALIFPCVCSHMPQNKVAAQGVTLMVFCPSSLPQVCLMWGCAYNSAVCSKACWKEAWAGMVGYKLKCRHRATSAESAASHWCGNFGWRSVTKQLKWAKGRKAKGNNTWNWQLLALWTDSNSPRQGKAQILWLGALTGHNPLNHQRIFAVQLSAAMLQIPVVACVSLFIEATLACGQARNMWHCGSSGL